MLNYYFKLFDIKKLALRQKQWNSFFIFSLPWNKETITPWRDKAKSHIHFFFAQKAFAVPPEKSVYRSFYSCFHYFTFRYKWVLRNSPKPTAPLPTYELVYLTQFHWKYRRTKKLKWLKENVKFKASET